MVDGLGFGEARRPHQPSIGQNAAKEKGTMKRKKHTPNQIVEKLRQAQVLLAEGQSVGQIVQALDLAMAKDVIEGKV